jgi:hypothetical protein
MRRTCLGLGTYRVGIVNRYEGDLTEELYEGMVEGLGR